MELIEVVNRLKELGGITSLSSSEKAEIENLYLLVLDKKFIRTKRLLNLSIYLNRLDKYVKKIYNKLGGWL